MVSVEWQRRNSQESYLHEIAEKGELPMMFAMPHVIFSLEEQMKRGESVLRLTEIGQSRAHISGRAVASTAPRMCVFDRVAKNEYFIMMMRGVNLPAASHHENAEKIYKAYQVAPVENEPDEGILFQGYAGLADNATGAQFRLQPELANGLMPGVVTGNMLSSHTQRQLIYAHLHIPRLAEYMMIWQRDVYGRGE